MPTGDQTEPILAGVKHTRKHFTRSGSDAGTIRLQPVS